MSWTPPTIAKSLAVGAACALLIALATISPRPPAPLTASEKRLVGNWNHIALPSEETLSEMTFAADRTFQSNHGQFVGRWWIQSGQLHVRYWSDDWRDDWSPWWQFTRLWRALRRNNEIWEIRFHDLGDRVELTQPGKLPDCTLIRSSE